MIEKAVGGPDTISAHARSVECTPKVDDDHHVIETIAKWDPVPEADKGLGIDDDPLTPDIEGDEAEPADDYTDHSQDPLPDHPSGDHAIAEGFVDTL
jgi:hypothetical protein